MSTNQMQRRRGKHPSLWWTWLIAFGFLSHPLHVNPSTELFISDDDDRIHAKIDSQFRVRNFGSLFDFLDQEERVRNLRFLEKAVEDMRAHLDDLMSQDDEDVDVEKVILRSEPDCARAGDLYKKLNLLESVLLSLEAKGFKTEHFISTSRVKLSADHALPDCLQSVSPDTTAKLFEQLKAYKTGRGLHVSPETDILSVVPVGLTPLEYAASISQALKKNNTSWVLFDLATYYYRLSGDGNTAMECARRALHYSPKKYKDVAYLNMASLLFRADYPRDAAAMTEMALDAGGESVPAWTLMGLILASLSEFEKSIEALSNAVGLDKRNNRLLDYLYAIKCHAKVHKGLSDQHEGLREVIEQFERIGQTTKKIHAVSSAVYDAKDTASVGLLALRDHEAPGRYSYTFERDGSYSVGRSCHKNVCTVPTWRSSLSLSAPTIPPKFGRVFAPDLDYYFLSPDWPTSEECLSHVGKDNHDQNARGVLMLLENKGFEFWRVVSALSAPAGIPLPHCEAPSMFKLPMDLQLEMMSASNGDDRARYPDLDMVQVLEDYMGQCGSHEEFARKISFAFVLGLLPAWMFYQMATVYWRAKGITSRAADCVIRAYYLVPPKYKDVVLVNMASFFAYVNETESALAMVKEAVDVTAYEPTTLYAMGNVLGSHGFLGLAVKNYRLTLTQDVSFYPALEALRRARCAQKSVGSTEKTSTLLESLGNGIIEIGIMDTRTGMHIVKRTTEQVGKNDNVESLEFRLRLKAALHELKNPKNTGKA